MASTRMPEPICHDVLMATSADMTTHTNTHTHVVRERRGGRGGRRLPNAAFALRQHGISNGVVVTRGTSSPSPSPSSPPPSLRGSSCARGHGCRRRRRRRPRGRHVAKAGRGPVTPRRRGRPAPLGGRARERNGTTVIACRGHVRRACATGQRAGSVIGGRRSRDDEREPSIERSRSHSLCRFSPSRVPLRTAHRSAYALCKQRCYAKQHALSRRRAHPPPSPPSPSV